MEITWYGHSCFRISERGMGSVICDPYNYQAIGYEPLKLKSDVVTISCNMPGHSYLNGIKGDPFVIDGPGEYEINNVFINGYSTNSINERPNTIYVIEYNGIFIGHLGDLDRIPTMSELENYGTIHILLVPVGGGSALNSSKAVELISLFKPNIVIPMHYSVPLTKPELDPLSKFLKEMGITQTEDVYPSYKISTISQLPEETKVIILNHPQSNEMENPEEADENQSPESELNEEENAG
ncbi:MAG: MBL fold metallo-hydrolase [Flexilinea sp.]